LLSFQAAISFGIIHESCRKPALKRSFKSTCFALSIFQFFHFKTCCPEGSAKVEKLLICANRKAEFLFPTGRQAFFLSDQKAFAPFFSSFFYAGLQSCTKKREKQHIIALSLMLIASCLLQPCVLLVFIRGGGRTNFASPVWGLKERHSKNLNTFGQDLLNRQKEVFRSFYGCFFFN
jgi:hypothetical protein